MTQPEVVAAVERTVPTSQDRIKRYALELGDAVAEHGRAVAFDAAVATAD